MGDVRITTEELAEALAKALAATRAASKGQGWTTKDLAKEWGVSLATTRGRIRAMMDSGLMKMSGSRYEVGINGRSQPKPLFVLVKPKARRSKP